MLKEKKIISEIAALIKSLEEKKIEERKIIIPQINSLENLLKRTNQEIPVILEKISLVRPLHPKSSHHQMKNDNKQFLEPKKKLILRKAKVTKKEKTPLKINQKKK